MGKKVDTVELLGCPFCGSMPYIEFFKDETKDADPGYYVGCTGGCILAQPDICYQTLEDLGSDWNRREGYKNKYIVEVQ